MFSKLEQTHYNYADVALKIGVNLQHGQRLFILAPIQTAPFVRLLATKAYQLGAKFVDVMWKDEVLDLIQHQHAPPNSFKEFPIWRPYGIVESIKQGDAQLTIRARNPDLLKGQNPNLIALAQKTHNKHFQPVYDAIWNSAMNWSQLNLPSPEWATKVFPDIPLNIAQKNLWQAICSVCRLQKTDPIAAWQHHLNGLLAKTNYLNHKQYTTLKYRGPGTNLTIGLVKNHLWLGPYATTNTGLNHTPNLPIEEIFTVPHKDKTEGVVTSTKPLSYSGTIIEDFSLTFVKGKVVKATANKGETTLRRLLETDEGARQLGEVALVPHSSLVSKTKLTFFDMMFDENVANHLALGRAFKFNLQHGKQMSNEEFANCGGNYSTIHLDFMIGSAKMDIDGLLADGSSEAIMRNGEWAF